MQLREAYNQRDMDKLVKEINYPEFSNAVKHLLKGHALTHGTARVKTITHLLMKQPPREPRNSDPEIIDYIEDFRAKHYPKVASRHQAVFAKPVDKIRSWKPIHSTYGPQSYFLLPDNKAKYFQTSNRDDGDLTIGGLYSGVDNYINGESYEELYRDHVDHWKSLHPYSDEEYEGDKASWEEEAEDSAQYTLSKGDVWSKEDLLHSLDGYYRKGAKSLNEIDWRANGNEVVIEAKIILMISQQNLIDMKIQEKYNSVTDFFKAIVK